MTPLKYLACSTLAVAATLIAPASALGDPVPGLANPGPIYDGTTWTVLATGAWDDPGHRKTNVNPLGDTPWQTVDEPLLTGRPDWADNANRTTWAPSVIQGTDGTYVAFYSSIVDGTTDGNRCIGTAHSDSLAEPFTPYPHPIACWDGSGAGAQDRIVKETGRRIALIDPTPYELDDGSMVLTYKTQAQKADDGSVWHTTTRMLKLDPADPHNIVPNPINADGSSVKLTDSVDDQIEENPGLVQQGGKYTLFTSYGWYDNGGGCDTHKYRTYYRQNANLWTGWLSKTRTLLPITSDFAQPCGAGNAQVVKGVIDGSWRIFFNTKATPESDFLMHVGIVQWGTGTPRVTSVY